jgi:5-methylcytosine-specific restriction endonuclease McrA
MVKFELDEYPRNVTDGDLLDDLRRIAAIANKGRVTIPVYKLLGGKYSTSTLTRRFGSFKKARALAGLVLNKRTDISDEELLEDLRRVAAKLGTNSIAGEVYSVNGGRFETTLLRRFQTWNKALERAGLAVVHRKNIPDDELLSNIESVWRHIGRQPKFDEMRLPISKFVAKTYCGRFGTWRKALEAFISFVNKAEKDADVSDEELSFVNKDEKDADVPDEELSTSEALDVIEPSAAVQISTRSTRHINWRTRFLVMRRDDFKCGYCGRSPSNNPGLELHIDHVKAWSKDGPTTMDNLRTACNVCNIGKSDLEAEEQP